MNHLINKLALEFISIAGRSINGLEVHLSPTTLTKRFISHFGISPQHCAILWCVAEDSLLEANPLCEEKHLLWMLNVLKTDETEHVLKGRWMADEKTIRKWLYICLNVIARLGLIDFDNRLDGNTRLGVYITIDGTDFPIKEPSPFSPTWYGHKFKGPGVQYEVGVCITTGWIVWMNGPYRAGTWSDLRIAKRPDGLRSVLLPGERYIADGTYKCPEALIPYDAITWYETYYMSAARARHETVNQLFKQFRVIRNKFSRAPEKHGLFTHAIAQIVQLGIMTGEKAPYDVWLEEPPTWPQNWPAFDGFDDDDDMSV